jgi:hypothetical protein
MVPLIWLKLCGDLCKELGLYTGIPTPTTDVVPALMRPRAQRATEVQH